MRSVQWCWIALVVALGCKAEVAEPELRRPIESMPTGACALLLASDLANTWERAEAHDALGVLQRALPENLVAPPELQAFQERLAAFETRTGTDLRTDLWLNLLRQRLAIGVYSDEAEGPANILFVAELDDGERFSKAFAALLQEPGTGWQVESAELDGKPATRVRDGDRAAVIVQEGNFLAAATNDELVRAALAIQSGGSGASILQDPACAAALEALGRQSVAVLGLGPEGERWHAQGLTWDRDGVHFKCTVPMPPPSQPVETATPARRDEILNSIPAGVTLAYYAQPTEMDLLKSLFQNSGCGLGSRGASNDMRPPMAGAEDMAIVTAAAPPLGLDRLPFDLSENVLPWAGDEMAIVLSSLLPSTLMPLPDLALVIEAADVELATSTLRDLEKAMGIVPGVGARGFDDVPYGGKTYRSLSQPVIESLAPSYLIDGDLVVLATTRELMQRIIDVRRAGRGHLLRDPAFRPLARFVPTDASLAVFADQTKLHHASMQVASMPRLFGNEVEHVMEIVEGLQVIFEHFPAGAVYVERQPQAITLQGWMLEAKE